MTAPEPRRRRLARAGLAAEDERTAPPDDAAAVDLDRPVAGETVLEQELVERVVEREARPPGASSKSSVPRRSASSIDTSL